MFLQGAYADCGTASGTDYTLSTNSSTSCAPALNATSVTIDSGVTLTGSPSTAGMFVNNHQDLPIFTNSGTVVGGSSSNSAVYIGHFTGTGGSIGTINNNALGIISNSSYGIIVDFPDNSIGALNNRGLISGGYSGIDNFGSITSINNYGIFEQTLNSPGYGAAIHNYAYSSSGGTIGSIINQSSGLISGTLAGIGNDGSTVGVIGLITNYGSIVASQGYGIVNSGSNQINTLNNAQGAGNAYGSLTYSGNLPTNYNIIINSPSNFGRLAVTGAGSTATTFGIYSGSVVSNGTYSSVLSGFSSSNLLITTGTYGGGSWSLVNSSGSLWDLVFSGIVPPVTTTDITTGSGNYLANIGTTLNPVFAGGTLTLLNGDNSNQTFVVEASGGTISAPTTGSATLGGVFSGSGAMTFNGSGTTYMNGINTYSGGTTVASGTLSVGSSETYNTARLAGDVTVQAAGTLAGHGGIVGAVTNSGTVAPGGSIGTLSVGGSYVQTSSGTLSTSITPSENSVLAVTGKATIAGNFSIDASAGVYTKRIYTVLTSSGLTGKFSGVSGNLASYSPLGTYLSYDANNAYLELVASRADTQQSLVNTASVLQGIYTLQNTVLVNGFSYDCNLFGTNNVCISAGGRNTSVQAEGVNNTSALLIAAYRPAPNYRVGAWADQNLSMNSPGGTVKLGNNTPVLGVFGAWNEKADGSGAEIKVAAGYGQKNATITRAVVGTSDAGSGSSNLTTQGAQLQAKYGYALLDNTMVSPYVGVRYTQSNMGGYSEGYNANVTAPLTYQALNTNATTAIVGVGVSYKPIAVATLLASAGVETDTSTSNGSYSASSVKIAGLTPINFNANPVKTRPTATVGAYYDVEKNQRLGITGIYRQEPYQAVSTTTVMATYTLGM